ncbi:hypothetical protein TWF281_004502 [Arthrobotrys megalospora]
MEEFLISAGTKLGISAIKAFGGNGGSAAGAALGAIAGAFDEDGGGDFGDFGGGDDIGGDSVDFGGGGEDIGGGFDNDAGGGGEEYTEDYTGEEYYDGSADTTGLDGGGEYYEGGEGEPATDGAYDESAGYEEGYNDDGTYTDEYGVTYDENGYVLDDGSGYDYSAEEGGFDQTTSPSGEAATYGDGYTYQEQEGEHAHLHGHGHATHRGLGTGLALGGAAVAGAAVLGGVALAARKARGRGRGGPVAGRGRGAAAAAGCAPWARGGAVPRGRGRPQSFSGQGGVRPPLQHSATAPAGMMQRGGFRGRGAPRGRGRGVPLGHQNSFPVAARGRGAARARGMARGGYPGAGRGAAILPTALGQPPCPQQVPQFNGISPQSTGHVANGFQETLGSPPPYTAVVSNVPAPAAKLQANPAQLDQMSKRKLAALQQIQRREKDRIDAKRREEEADRKRLEVAQNGEKPCQEPVEPKVQINLPLGVKPLQSTVDVKKQDINPPQELPPNVSQAGFGRSNSVLAPQLVETPRPVSYVQNTNSYPPAPAPAPVRTQVPVPGNLIEMDGGQFVKPTVPVNSPAPVSYGQSPPAHAQYGNIQNQQPGSNRWSTVSLPSNPVELGNTQHTPNPNQQGAPHGPVHSNSWSQPQQQQQQQATQGPQRTLSMLQRFPSRKPIQQQRPVSMMIPPSHAQSMLNNGFDSKSAQNQQGFQYPHQQGRQSSQNQAPPQFYPHNAPREPKKEIKEEEEEGWKPPPLKVIQRRKFNSGEPDPPPQEKTPENISPKSGTPSHETSAFVPPPPPPMPFDGAPPPPPSLPSENAQPAQPPAKPIENAQQTPSLSLPVRNALATKPSNENVQQAHAQSLPSENVQQAQPPSGPTETTQLSHPTAGAVENANAQSVGPKPSIENHELVETPKVETPKGYFENFAPGVNIPGLTVRKGSLPASLPSRTHQETTHLPHPQFQNQHIGSHGTTMNQAGQHHSTTMNQTAHHSTLTNTAVHAGHFSHETSTPTVLKNFHNFPPPQGSQNPNGSPHNYQMPPNQPSLQYSNTFPAVPNPNQPQPAYNNNFNDYPRPPVAPQPFNNNLNNVPHPPSHIMEMPASTGFAPLSGAKSPYDMNPMIAELPEIPTAIQGAQKVDEADYLNRSEGISYETKDKEKKEEQRQGEDEIKMSANSWGFGWDRF